MRKTKYTLAASTGYERARSSQEMLIKIKYKSRGFSRSGASRCKDISTALKEAIIFVHQTGKGYNVINLKFIILKKKQLETFKSNATLTRVDVPEKPSTVRPNNVREKTQILNLRLRLNAKF